MVRFQLTFLGVVALERLHEEKDQYLVDGEADDEKREEGGYQETGQPEPRVDSHHWK